MSPFYSEETLALVVTCKIMLVTNSFKLCSNMQNDVCHDSKLHVNFVVHEICIIVRVAC